MSDTIPDPCSISQAPCKTLTQGLPAIVSSSDFGVSELEPTIRPLSSHHLIDLNLLPIPLRRRYTASWLLDYSRQET